MVDRKGLLVFLLFSIPILAASEHQKYGSDHNLIGLFQSLFKITYRSWLQLLDKTQWMPKKAIESNSEKTALVGQKRINNLLLTSVTVEGSMVPNEDLQLPHFVPFLQESRQVNNSICTCLPTLDCEITCTSLEIRCKRTCTHLTVFTAAYYRKRNQDLILSTSVKIYDNNCDTLSSACIATTKAAVAVAIAAVVAIAVAVPVSLQFPQNDQFIPTEEIGQQVSQFLNYSRFIDKLTPVNRLTFPVRGIDFPDDSCGDNSVQFSDGNCYPVLKRGNCRNPQHWVTVDPITLQGRCTPRLCGRERVFVGRDGLCHDINDPYECQGGRRLYYTAYGDPICDCPVGQYPFPNSKDDCIPLFSKGPCREGNVVAISPKGRLGCTPTECQSIDGEDKSLQLVPTENAVCYALGSRGPCSTSTSQLLGYDIFKRRLQCVNLEDPSSSYFVSPREKEMLDSIYNQLYPEYDDYRISLMYQSLEERNDKGQRRQGANTAGIFQFPSSSLETLLQPCRTGARQGMNFKCTNPLVSDLRTRVTMQAVRPAFRCPLNRTLQATGKCVNDNRFASCGPSFQFNFATGQCRSIFKR